MSDPKFICFHKLLGTQIFMSSQVIRFGLAYVLEAGAEVQMYYLSIIAVIAFLVLCFELYGLGKLL